MSAFRGVATPHLDGRSRRHTQGGPNRWPALLQPYPSISFSKEMDSYLRGKTDQSFNGACEAQRSSAEWYNPGLSSPHGFRTSSPTEFTGTLGDDENSKARLVQYDTA